MSDATMDAHLIVTILQHELREARRNRWVVLCAAVFGVLALAFSLLGFSGLGRFGVSGFGRTAASLLHLVMAIVPLMGLVMGAMSIAVEREQGTLATLLAQPVSPAEVLVGKFLGAAAALGGALLLGFGISGLVMVRAEGLAHAGLYLGLVGWTLLLGLAHLALGFWLSSVARRGATAIGLALLVWLVVVFFSDLGVMGTALALKFTPSQLLWTSLLNPSQAFKLGVIQGIDGTLERLGPSGRYAAEALGRGLAPVLTAWLMGWVLVPLGAAFACFQRRGAL